MSVAAFIADQKTGHDVPHAVACRALGVPLPPGRRLDPDTPSPL